MGLADACGYFPVLSIKSRQDKELKMLGINPPQYMGMAVLLSLALSFLSFLVLVLLKVEPAIAFALLAFALVFGLFLILPRVEIRKKTAEMEAEMPFFLRTAGMLLQIGIPFERALETAAEGTLGKEIAAIRNEMRNGVSLQRAFSSFAASMPSLVIKRAVSQLISAYEIGSRGKEMKEIGDELLYIEQHKLKQYAARSAMFGLIFIMSSAIFPTFFLVYAIIGKFAFGTEISDFQVMLAMLIVFPLVSAATIIVSRASMPHSSFSNASGFDIYLLLPGGLFAAGFLVPQLQLAFLLMGTALGGYFIYKNHKAEKKIEEIEEMLPDALFSVSGMPKSTRPERIFETIENGSFGALSEEASKSRRQLAMNVKLDSVLDDMWQRNPSTMLKKTCMMMKQMFHTNTLNRLDMLAEDIIRHFQIRRERSQVFALQKYTLMLGALLVPLIMNTALSLLESMGGLLDDGSVGEAVAFSQLVVPPYLMLYAMIASAAIADAEGKKSLAVFYFLGLAAVSLLTFHFIGLWA